VPADEAVPAAGRHAAHLDPGHESMSGGAGADPDDADHDCEPPVADPADAPPMLLTLPATRPPAPGGHADAPAARYPAIEIRSPAPAARQSPAPRPVARTPATPQPAAQEPAAQGPAAQEPAAQEPATPQPAIQEPATPEPATPEPATPEPAEADQAFWLPVEEVSRPPAWPVPQTRGGRSGSVHRSMMAVGRPAPPREPRRTGAALVALVLLSLCAAFFGWVSAEPLWLAVGHGDHGTATVTRCTGSGIGQRCVGEFATADGFTARVALLGLTDAEGKTGAAVSARMVDRDSRQAYVGDDHLALHLRWTVGLLLVLLCGAGIAWASGATRLEDRRARRRAVLGSLAGPLLLTVGFLAATW
jgi:hypothetical protein